MLSLEYTSDFNSDAVLILDNSSASGVGNFSIESPPILIDQSMKYNVCAHYINYAVGVEYNFSITGFEIRVSDDFSFSTYEVLTSDNLKIIGNIEDFIKSFNVSNENYLASIGIVGVSEKYIKFILNYTVGISSDSANNTSIAVWIEKMKHVSK